LTGLIVLISVGPQMANLITSSFFYCFIKIFKPCNVSSCAFRGASADLIYLGFRRSIDGKLD